MAPYIVIMTFVMKQVLSAWDRKCFWGRDLIFGHVPSCFRDYTFDADDNLTSSLYSSKETIGLYR